MPIKDPQKRKEYFKKYFKEQWYPKHKKKYQEYSKKRKALLYKLVVDIKVKSGCIDCGFKNEKYPTIFEFDHIGNKKYDNIATMISRGCGKDNILKEIGKCEVVCANCHRIRTAKRHKAG